MRTHPSERTEKIAADFVDRGNIDIAWAECGAIHSRHKRRRETRHPRSVAELRAMIRYRRTRTDLEAVPAGTTQALRHFQ